MCCETNTDDGEVLTLGTLDTIDFPDVAEPTREKTPVADFKADDRDEQAITHLAGLYNLASDELRQNPEFVKHLAGLCQMTTGAEYPLWRRLAREIGSKCGCGQGQCPAHDELATHQVA